MRLALTGHYEAPWAKPGQGRSRQPGRKQTDLGSVPVCTPPSSSAPYDSPQKLPCSYPPPTVRQGCPSNQESRPRPPLPASSLGRSRRPQHCPHTHCCRGLSGAFGSSVRGLHVSSPQKPTPRAGARKWLLDSRGPAAPKLSSPTTAPLHWAVPIREEALSVRGGPGAERGEPVKSGRSPLGRQLEGLSSD